MIVERTTRSWTPEQRQDQARRLRERKIWLKSTGPRTPEGKDISKMNAWKHGAYCRQAYAFRAALRRNALTIKFLFQKQKELLRFQRNELRDQKSQQGAIRKRIRASLSLKSPLKRLYDRIHP